MMILLQMRKLATHRWGDRQTRFDGHAGGGCRRPGWAGVLALLATLAAQAGCDDDPPAANTCTGPGCGADAGTGDGGSIDHPHVPPVDSAPGTGRDGVDEHDGAAEGSSDAGEQGRADLSPDDSGRDLAIEVVDNTNGSDDGSIVIPKDALVGFSVTGRTFNQPFALRLATVAPSVQVFFTVDGSIPTEQSTPYTSPIPIDRNLQVRVLALAGANRQIVTEVYLHVADDLVDFTSNLPLVFLHSFAAVEPAIDNYEFTPGAMLVLPPVAGITRPLGAMDTASRMGFKVRGFSSRNAPQHSFTVELWGTADRNDRHLSMLGLPAESDWVLYAPGEKDQSLMRNALFYALSNRVGRYAPRTRFVEVFLASVGQPLSRATYRGVYTLVEKVKRDPNRVNITELQPSDVADPGLTGGYIFKVDDHLSPDELPLLAGGRIMEMVHPGSDEIVPAQRDYIAGYIDQLVAALNAPGFVNPTTGKHYSDYIDVDSWIDLHILNIFAKNADALRVSAFFHKDRGGKLKAGPMWDLDRSSGSNDYRVKSPEGWNVLDGTEAFKDPWWDRLFMDPAFQEKYWTRWEQLLATDLRSDVLTPMVVNMANELSVAQERHFGQWPRVQPAFGYLGEIFRLTSWLDARIAWTSSHLRTYEP